MDIYRETIFPPEYSYKVKSFYSSDMEHAITVHPHWHTAVEILFILEGCAKQQVNDSFFTAEAGDIIIIAEDQLHSTYSFKGIACNILVLQFDSFSLLGNILSSNKKNLSAYFGNRVKYKNPLKSHNSDGGCILKCINEIHDELCQMHSAYDLIIGSLLQRMVGFLLRYECFEISKENNVDQEEARQMLDKTFSLIDKCYSEKITLKMAAMESNLSVTHFCRLFKKSTGMTFNEYLTFYRINRAEKMMNSSRKIIDISNECGFGSLSSFLRNFKKYKQCTPSLYKK